MDMKSLLQQKVESSLDYSRTQKQASLNRAEAAAQYVNDVTHAIYKLSQELKRYNSGVSIKLKHDSIVLHYKYGCYDNDSSGPGYYRTFYWQRNSNFCRLYTKNYCDDAPKFFDDAQSAINWITEWCADRITDSMSKRGQAAKRRAIFIKVVILSIIAFYILLFTRLF